MEVSLSDNLAIVINSDGAIFNNPPTCIGVSKEALKEYMAKGIIVPDKDGFQNGFVLNNGKVALIHGDARHYFESEQEYMAVMEAINEAIKRDFQFI